MRLLSFLSEIETALRVQANAPEGTIWSTYRMMSPAGVARLSLLRLPDAPDTFLDGAIELTHHQLADGHFSVDVKLSWSGCQQTSKMYVYSSACSDWKAEARAAADVWLAKFRAMKAAV